MNVILAAATIPLIAAVFIWLGFYIRYDVRRLRPLIKSFKMLSYEAEGIIDCKKENLISLEVLIDAFIPDSLSKSWAQMNRCLEDHYGGELIPQGKTFFHFDSLVEIDGNRTGAGALYKSFWVFGILTLSLPILTSILLYPSYLMFAACAGLCAFTLIAVIWLLFLFADGSIFHNAEREYSRFINEFDRIAPVAGEEAALTYEASRKNQIAFNAAANKIVRGFDDFAGEMVMPALQEALTQISDNQDQGMAKLADKFSRHLTETLDTRIAGLSKTIRGIQVELTQLKDGLSENVSSLNNLLVTQRSVLEDAGHKLTQSGEAQIKAVAKAEEIQKKVYDSSELLVIQMETLSETVEAITKQNDRFSLEANNMLKAAGTTQAQIAAQLISSQSSLEASVNATNSLFEGITEKMNESMAEAGKEIALGIKEATGDNAEAIEKITEQSMLLREDYDNYFSRIDSYSKNTYEELEYHVQNIISSITEEIGKMLLESNQANQAVLADYSKSTNDLMIAFKEQSNSISLYAREIDLDVNELSENLKSSVAEFSHGLDGSVESIMREFDSGLAELSLRIANTVESICDAVEALPNVLGKK